MLRRPCLSLPSLALLALALLGAASCGDDALEPASPAPPPWAQVAPEQIAEAKRHGVSAAFENEFGMRFVLIPAGTFPKPFYMQVSEVTNAQYAAFLEDSGYEGATEHPSSREPYLGTWKEGRFLEGRGRYPICGVNWYHAHAYCSWLSTRTGRRARLPTEAEWEYVARGQEGRTYPWGDAWDPTACNWGDAGKVDGFAGAAPVGSFPTGATREGVYDLAGNVWEWCADAVRGVPDDIGTRTAHDVDAKRPRHPLRGGPWCLDSEAMRSDGKWYTGPSIADDKIGFRVLVEIAQRLAR